MGEPVLRLEGIVKRFGELSILEGVDLTVEAGQRVAILGPSGSGKSTLLHIAGLMERPTSGRVLLNGNDVLTHSEQSLSCLRLDHIGFVFQFHHLLADFTLLENVLIPARLALDDMGAATQRAKEILDRLELSHRLTHHPQQLSGEQQRAALARALLRKPKLLLCDEPTGNLDTHTAEGLMKLLTELARAENAAILIVTHNERFAKEADAAYRLQEGALASEKIGAH